MNEGPAAPALTAPPEVDTLAGMGQEALLNESQQLYQHFRERLLHDEEERNRASEELYQSLQLYRRHVENLVKGPPADNKTEVPPDEDPDEEAVPAATTLAATIPPVKPIAVVSQDQGHWGPTCPPEIKRQRRQFEKRALLVPEVEDEESLKVIDIGVQKKKSRTVWRTQRSRVMPKSWMTLGLPRRSPSLRKVEFPPLISILPVMKLPPRRLLN